MPNENDTKPCYVEGCSGTMRFSQNARPPGWGAGTGVGDGKIVWGAQEQPGWECNENRGHFEFANGQRVEADDDE
jgi:hypothetical protein